LDLYGRLIRKGRSLDEIIRDLRDALYRYPVEVPIWQALVTLTCVNRLQAPMPTTELPMICRGDREVAP
jgi:hypothetical protein